MRRLLQCIAIVSGVIALGSAARASETVTYSYDARGRLVQVARSGSVNNNVTTYGHDKASNRASKTVS